MNFTRLAHRLDASADGGMRLLALRRACSQAAGQRIRMQEIVLRGCFGGRFKEYVFAGECIAQVSEVKQ